MTDEEIPFGRTVSYISGTAPPLDADEVKPSEEEPYYWQATRTYDEPDVAQRCHGRDRRLGHGHSPDGRWVCTRKHQHTGPHIAQIETGVVCAVWSDQ